MIYTTVVAMTWSLCICYAAWNWELYHSWLYISPLFRQFSHFDLFFSLSLSPCPSLPFPLSLQAYQSCPIIFSERFNVQIINVIQRSSVFDSCTVCLSGCIVICRTFVILPLTEFLWFLHDSTSSFVRLVFVVVRITGPPADDCRALLWFSR